MENKTSTFNARTAALLLAAAILASCGKPAPASLFSNRTDTPDPRPTILDPGQWELTITGKTDVVRPFGSTPPAGFSPEEGEPVTRTLKLCVTRDLAADPGPVLIGGSDALSRCQRNVWTLRNGRIDGDLTCPGGRSDSPSLPLRVTGSYARDHFESEADEQAAIMNVHARIEGKRVGQCTGYERSN